MLAARLQGLAAAVVMLKFRLFSPAVPNDPLVPTAVLGEMSGLVERVTFTTSCHN